MERSSDLPGTEDLIALADWEQRIDTARADGGDDAVREVGPSPLPDGVPQVSWGSYLSFGVNGASSIAQLSSPPAEGHQLTASTPENGRDLVALSILMQRKLWNPDRSHGLQVVFGGQYGEEYRRAQSTVQYRLHESGLWQPETTARDPEMRFATHQLMSSSIAANQASARNSADFSEDTPAVREYREAFEKLVALLHDRTPIVQDTDAQQLLEAMDGLGEEARESIWDVAWQLRTALFARFRAA